MLNQRIPQIFTLSQNEALSVIARISRSYENKKEDFPEGKSSKVKLCA